VFKGWSDEVFFFELRYVGRFCRVQREIDKSLVTTVIYSYSDCQSYKMVIEINATTLWVSGSLL